MSGRRIDSFERVAGERGVEQGRNGILRVFEVQCEHGDHSSVLEFWQCGGKRTR